MRWITWLYPGINVKRWLFLFTIGVLLCAFGLAFLFNFQIMGALEELVFRLTYATTGKYSNVLVVLVGGLFVLFGLGFMIYGTRKTIKSVVTAVMPEQSGSLMEKVFVQRKLTHGPAITVVTTDLIVLRVP